MKHWVGIAAVTSTGKKLADKQQAHKRIKSSHPHSYDVTTPLNTYWSWGNHSVYIIDVILQMDLAL